MSPFSIDKKEKALYYLSRTRGRYFGMAERQSHLFASDRSF